MTLPLSIPCHRCGAVVMVSGDGADLVALVEEKNRLVRRVAELEAQLPPPAPENGPVARPAERSIP